MILRPTQKLAAKLKVRTTESLPLDANPYADWSAHLFRENCEQFIMVMNTASLYAVVMHGRGITNADRFLSEALGAIHDVLEVDGLGFFYSRFIEPAAGEVRFSKALSRSVTGSMNDLVKLAKVSLFVGGRSLHDLSFRTNRTPMSAIGMRSQREVFKSLSAPA
jgi:hypothetical protein